MSKHLSATLCLFIFATAAPLWAEVKPNALFSDGVVLQRDMELPIWGSAREGERVTVSLEGQEAVTTAKNGKWLLRLPPQKAGGPYTMTIRGDNTVTIHDLYVGEVWVCSGQSNMAFNLSGADTAETEIPRADYPKLRMFTVGNKHALQPVTELSGSWMVCSPQTAKQFSAVGYFFGRDLVQATNLPVGMIHTSMSGSPGQAWLSFEALEKEPELANYVTAIQAQKEAYPSAKTSFLQATKDYELQLQKWTETEGKTYNEALVLWAAESKKARAEGKPEPAKPELGQPKPVKPPDPEGSSGSPTVLYNGKVSPIIPYAIRGVIWYQGESNGGKEYRTLFPRLISDWRERWAQGDFPFLFVQIAPYKDQKPEIREAQLLTWQKVPNTAMVVTTDLGEPTNIHPKRKEPVGARLALAARALVYGEKIEYSGPVFAGLKIEGNQAIVSFAHVGSGLMAKDGDLKGFTLAGSDHKFFPARAEIKEDRVVVTSANVPVPVAVRYGWANVPDVNLFNQEGIPATPFRSDVE